MKNRSLITILPLLLGTATFSAAQQSPPQPPRPPALAPPAPPPAEQPAEKPFSLTFPGGPVEKFVTAVEQATAEPFNLIIPASARSLEIPPVRVQEVTLSRLLAALSSSSVEQKAVATGQSSVTRSGGSRSVQSNIQYVVTEFKFTATPGTGGTTVWQLTANRPPELPQAPPPPPLVRFYQLKPNLESGLKVEDITTVAQTAWRMMKLEESEIPQFKLHEETGILIAVGQEEALQVLDSILRELPKSGAAKAAPEAARPVPPRPAGAIPPQ